MACMHVSQEEVLHPASCHGCAAASCTPYGVGCDGGEDNRNVFELSCQRAFLWPLSCPLSGYPSSPFHPVSLSSLRTLPHLSVQHLSIRPSDMPSRTLDSLVCRTCPTVSTLFHFASNTHPFALVRMLVEVPADVLVARTWGEKKWTLPRTSPPQYLAAIEVLPDDQAPSLILEELRKWTLHLVRTTPTPTSLAVAPSRQRELRFWTFPTTLILLGGIYMFLLLFYAIIACPHLRPGQIWIVLGI
ncbi:hypothetical protein DFH09DRAFT_1102916 [Mycena vulgaris]|nr:hypothetical protein DFH09DRAFT_1102916 [Mycena vulgaris]